MEALKWPLFPVRVCMSSLKRKLTYFHLGVGTRNYYRRLGYELDGPYMSKWLGFETNR
jgi:histone acetyltransferase (RNA polymerase elongator complex component)